MLLVSYTHTERHTWAWFGVQLFGEEGRDLQTHTWLMVITAALQGSRIRCQVFSTSRSLGAHFHVFDSKFIRKNIKALTRMKMYFVLEVQNTRTPK